VTTAWILFGSWTLSQSPQSASTKVDLPKARERNLVGDGSFFFVTCMVSSKFKAYCARSMRTNNSGVFSCKYERMEEEGTDPMRNAT
jgi:hypothetical protein